VVTGGAQAGKTAKHLAQGNQRGPGGQASCTACDIRDEDACASVDFFTTLVHDHGNYSFAWSIIRGPVSRTTAAINQKGFRDVVRNQSGRRLLRVAREVFNQQH